jgi:15-cis-phytoene synthase
VTTASEAVLERPSAKRSVGVSEEDLRHCEDLLRAGSKSFYGASRLLPARIRPPTVALYAFCRTADDAVDDPSLQDRASRVLAADQLSSRLDRVYDARKPRGAVERAFAEVARMYDIPRALPEALVDGMRWDAEGREVPTLGALEAYAARVAGSVGVMMTLVMGVNGRVALARACDLGVAMQLTNVARDVGADGALGRVYLPTSWLSDEGLSREEALRLASKKTFDPRLACLTMRLLRRADLLYARAESGVSSLPADCRAAIFGARLVYADIGREIVKNRCDSVTRRAVVSSTRKLWLLARARATAAAVGMLPTTLSDDPPLDATRFLVDAACAP